MKILSQTVLPFRRGKKNSRGKSVGNPLPKNQAEEPERTKLKSRVSKSVMFAALAGLLSGPAAAGEIPYAVAMGANEQLRGIVNVDDSSGEMTSAKGTASGAVSGEYALDAMSADAALRGGIAKLDVHLDRKSQQLRARLDSCPASLDACTSGNWVTLWEQ